MATPWNAQNAVMEPPWNRRDIPPGRERTIAGKSRQDDKDGPTADGPLWPTPALSAVSVRALECGRDAAGTRRSPRFLEGNRRLREPRRAHGASLGTGRRAAGAPARASKARHRLRLPFRDRRLATVALARNGAGAGELD